MTYEDVAKMCHNLAKKYNNPQEYDDLVSEGTLVALELINEGKTDKNLIYSHVQREMNDYYNLRRSPVYVPANSKSHSLDKEADTEGWTETSMYNALYGEVVEIDENVLQVESSEETFTRKEWLAYVSVIAITCLSRLEWEIIKLRYWNDKTQDDVSKMMKKSKMWVSRVEKVAIDKIRNNL